MNPLKLSSILKLFEFLFKIHKAEFWKVQIFFVFLIFFGAYWTFAATIGDTLFLSSFGDDSRKMIPWVYIGIAIVTVLVSLIADKLQNTFSKLKLICSVEMILALSVLIFRYAIKIENGFVFYALVIWLEVCALFSLTLIFSYMGDFFNSHDAKRVYAYINGGIAIGGIAAGYGVNFLIDFVSPENLLFLCALLLLALGIMPILISLKYKTIEVDIDAEEGEEEIKYVPTMTLFRNKYILIVFAIVFIQILYWVFLDFQLKSMASKELSKIELANFFGLFYRYMGIASLFVQFVLVRVLINRLGLLPSLLITPIISFIGSLIFFLTPRFKIIAAFNIGYLSFSETLNNPAKQLLFFPLSQRIRIKAQVFAGGVLTPLGQGAAGVLLIILVSAIENPAYYSIFVFILSGLSILLILLLKPFYKKILSDSLQKKQLNPSDLVKILSSPGSEEIIKEILLTENSEVALFTMNAIGSVEDISEYLPIIANLVDSQNEQIAAQAIRLIREKGDNAYLSAITKTMNNINPLVCSEAIITYCKFKKEMAYERISPFLNSDDEQIRIAVMIGLAEYSGFYGNLVIFPYLNTLLNSQDERHRLEATKVIGKIGGVGSGILIKKLLNDSSEIVRKEAIQSSWLVRDPILIPELVSNLQIESLKEFAVQAIQNMPPSAVAFLKEELLKEELAMTYKLTLIQSMSSIGGEESIQLLIHLLNSNSDCILLFEASKSLADIVANEHYPFNRDLISETENYIYENIILAKKARYEIGKINEFFSSLYYDHAILNLKILLTLFSLFYKDKQINNIQLQLFGSNETLIAYALELLEITIPKRDGVKSIPHFCLLIEKGIPEGIGLAEETLHEISSSKNIWLQKITIHANIGANTMKPTENQIDYYEIISRISFLKKVNLFADLPADYLASIVPLLKEKTFYKDEILFSQGEIGDAFYLIKTGSISVLANNIEVAVLGPGEGIGEMALIEGETRSATALLKEDSQLFKLSSNDFNKLLNSYSSITISLLKTLSQRLRIRAAKLT